MWGDEKMRPNTHGETNFNSWVKSCRWRDKIRNPMWCMGAIGSTSPATIKMIKLSWKFYKKIETHEMLSNMVQDWIHLLGFLHGNKNIHQEAPYVVGEIVKRLAKKVLLNEIVN